MPMKIGTFNQLQKLMMLTTSENDAEALGAIRKANSILKDHSYTWESAFKRLIKVDDKPEIESMADVNTRIDDEAKRIDEAFETLESRDPKGNFSIFIDSLKDQWGRNRRLSDKQKEALFKAVRNGYERRSE